MSTQGLTIPIFANLDSFEKTMNSLSKKTEDIGKKLSKSISLPIAALGTSAIKFSMDFETSLAKVSTIADSSAVSMAQMSEEITKLSNETGIASTEIANSVYDAISAGQKTEDAVNFVSNATKLAKAGFAETADALDILTTIMNSYGLEAEEVSRVSDVLINTQNMGKTTVAELSATMGKIIPTANSMGVSLEQVASGYALMTSKGIATAETTTYMNSMLNEMGKSGALASETIKKAFDGKSFQKLIEEGKSVGDVLAGMNDYAKKNNKSLADMFGSAEAGKAALILAGNAGEDFNEILESMGDVAGSTDKAFEKVSDTAKERFTKAMNRMKNALISLGNIMLPFVSKAFDAFSGLIEKLDNMPDGLKKAIVGVGLALAGIGPALLLISKGFAIFSKIGLLFSPVGLAISGVIASVVALKVAIDKNIGGLGDKFKKIVESIKDFVSKIKSAFEDAKKVFATDGLGAGITTFISQLTGVSTSKIEPIINTIIDIFNGLKETISTVFSAICSIVSGFIGVIGNVASYIKENWGSVSGVFEKVGNAIKFVFDFILKPAFDMVMGIVNTVSSWFKEHWTEIENVIKKVVDTIKMLFDNVLKPAFTVASAVIGVAIRAIIEVIKFITPALEPVLSFILGGINIVVSVIQGLVSVVSWVVNAIISSFTYLWNTVSNIFSTGISIIQGIFSAFSALFRGDWDALGQALIGVWETIKTGVSNACQSLLNWIDSTFGGLGSKMLQFGKDMIQGLINGVSSMVSKAVDAVKNVGSKMMSGIKGLLGIHSPSRVFRQYGIWTGEGLAIGVEKSQSVVDKATRSLGESVKMAGSDIFSTFDNINTRISDMSDMNLSSTVSQTKIQRYKEFNVGARKEEAVIENVIMLDGKVLTNELSPKFNVESGNRIKIDGRRMGVK